MGLEVRKLESDRTSEEFVFVQTTVGVAFGQVMYNEVVALISAQRINDLPLGEMSETRIHRIQSDTRDRVEKWGKALKKHYEPEFKVYDGEDDVQDILDCCYSSLKLEGNFLYALLLCFEKDNDLGDFKEFHKGDAVTESA